MKDKKTEGNPRNASRLPHPPEESRAAGLRAKQIRAASHSPAKKSSMDKRVELSAFVLAFLGWVCAILARILPVWTVTGDVDNATDSLALYWDGVWLTWQEHRTGSLHCGFYQALLALAGNFRSWKALLSASVGVGAFPVACYLAGLVWFPHRVQIKAASGSAFVLAGFLLLVVIAWTTHATYGKLEGDAALTRSWGAALYSGWTGTAMLLVGGGTLCAWCCVKVPGEAQEGRGESRQTQPQPEAGDPLFDINRAVFIQSPYREH